MKLVCWLAWLAFIATASAQEIVTYRGPCDASAAVALDPDHFAVANDEGNQITYYRRGAPASVGSLDLGAFLRSGGKESDIEGAAPIGSRVYWITSHGRSSSGKAHPSRQRFFATDIGPGLSLNPVGVPYTRLLDDLTADPRLARYRLTDAARRAPEAPGGLNIEGLAATPEGGVLIGFRNPLFEGRALVVPLANPAEVVAGERARLGAPIELDLGGRGIRGMEHVSAGYLIVAGPTADEGTFALYRWSGERSHTPVPVSVDWRDLRPEALFAIPQSSNVQLLSDDGGVRIDGAECKKLPAARQAFRSLTVPR
ncbi:MAG: DUF3616 domain-containing protein [Burkholderiales bacterium]|nr:DUF3616 domain-containing protein [Burkholderiales bacterium]